MLYLKRKQAQKFLAEKIISMLLKIFLPLLPVVIWLGQLSMVYWKKRVIRGWRCMGLNSHLFSDTESNLLNVFNIFSILGDKYRTQCVKTYTFKGRKRQIQLRIKNYQLRNLKQIVVFFLY